MRHRRRKQNGIVLLVCLVMLILFLLVGITFTLTATAFREGASANAAAHIAHDDGFVVTDAVAFQFIHGSTNTFSPMFGHNLFSGLYGNDGVRGTLTAYAPLPAVGGQFVTLTIAPNAGNVLSPLDHYYDGCVMTMLDGPAKGQSRRIMEYFATTVPPTFHVDTFFTASGQPVAGNLVLINGREFNGTGNGYNPVTGRSDTLDASGRPYALLPNLAYFEANTNYLIPGGRGGMDLPYTAPDYNHPWLAAGDPGATSSAQIKPSWHDPALINFWMIQTGGVANANFSRDLMRKISFRPIGQHWNTLKGISVTTDPNYADHPKFTGSNPLFNFLTGPWDVDNDGDGVYESVWIDPGLPVRLTADGRRYKALVAMYVRDLDGRINLNVHGTLAMTDPTYYGAVAGRFAGDNAGTTKIISVGGGYGPPEINPIYLLSAGNAAEVTDASAQFRRLLEGGQTVDVGTLGNYNPAEGDRKDFGRFGWSDLNTNATPDANEYAPGYPNFTDTLNQLLWTNRYGSINAFATPWDISGAGRIGLTHRGQPAFQEMGRGTDWIDSAYEQSYSRSLSISRYDGPFTAAEFEPVLRQFDPDAASLPNRLIGLAPRTTGFRDQLTFFSMDVPVVGLTAPRHLRDILRQNNEVARHITDLLRARVIKEQNLTLPITDAAIIGQVNTTVNGMIGPNQRMLSSEMLAGLRFDINRLFGNGIDDNNDGIIDNLAEAAAEIVYPVGLTNLLAPAAVQNQFAGVVFDYLSQGLDPSSGTFAVDRVNAARRARQEYAKQLYVLLMLMAEEGAFQNQFTGAEFGDDANRTPTEKYELMAQRLAQFAINVVDYRDADARCTPFEYDVRPFNGWSQYCDGRIYGQNEPAFAAEFAAENADTDRRVVWGCEAPAVVLSDSLSFHNIRAKDVTGVGDPMADLTYDQFAPPQGSTFIELYSPANPHRWSPGADGIWGGVGDDDANGATNDSSEAGWPGSDDVCTASRDLYTNNGSVNLSKRSPLPDNSPNGMPVWRLAISAPHLTSSVSSQFKNQSTGQPFRPASTSLKSISLGELQMNEVPGLVTPNTIPIERVVWFCATNNADLTAMVTNGVLSAAERNKIYYNQGANTLGELAPGRYLVVGPRGTTVLGKRSDGVAPNDGSYQQIGLTPGAATNQVTVNGLAQSTSTMPAEDTQTKRPQAMICAADRPADWVAAVPNPVNTPAMLGLNISESLPTPPAGTYYPPPPDVVDSVYTAQYDSPLDDPNGGSVTPASLLYASAMHTKEDFRTVFLQRLADPDAAFDAVSNPYITVDFMPLDLTIFNGEAQNFDKAATAAGNVIFRARERGAGGTGNFWAPAFGTQAVTAVGASTSFFNYQLVHSMGYLNSTFGVPIGTTLGPTVLGDPPAPFPWLAWFDRPYVSQYELLMVPSSAPARLNFEFSTALANNGDPYASFFHPFAHLLNFTQTANSVAQPDQSPQLGRVLDYLCVPSKYPESHQVLNAAAFAGPGVGKGRFRPPFNVKETYREPGKMNVNTIFSRLNWDSLGNGWPMPSWSTLVQSRRGYAATPADAQFTQFDATAAPNTMPSVMGNPFRSQTEWDLSSVFPATRREADVTLLRPFPDATNPAIAATPARPLFGQNTVGAANLHRESDFNAYFRYQQLNRLGNLTTTRSNVFAVWITVGYFEVEPVAVDAAHPDGYALATELGMDTGEIRRHKAFYIIDRTIPAAYENGKDYNSANTILLKTHIE